MTGPSFKRMSAGDPITDALVESFIGDPLADIDARAAPIFEQAKSAPTKNAEFTNCGNAENQETPAKQTKKKMTRAPFTVSQLMEFCHRRELVNQTGHDVYDWPLVVLKSAGEAERRLAAGGKQ